MELSELRDEVELILQDSSNNLWGATELNGYINHALKDVAKKAPWDLLGTLQGIETENITEDVVQYDLPSDFLRFVTASWNNHYVTRISVDQLPLLSKNDFYTPTSTSPKCYINEGKINYSPVVTPAVVNGKVLYYVKVPGTLSSDTDDSPMNDILDKAIIYNTVAQAFAKDEVDYATKYKQLYLEAIKEVTGE